MFFALFTAAFAAAPLDIGDIDDVSDVPTIYEPVSNVDFVNPLDVSAGLQGPSMTMVFAPNPDWKGSFIVLRQSFFPEIAASVKQVN